MVFCRFLFRERNDRNDIRGDVKNDDRRSDKPPVNVSVKNFAQIFRHEWLLAAVMDFCFLFEIRGPQSEAAFLTEREPHKNGECEHVHLPPSIVVIKEHVNAATEYENGP